MEAQPTETVEPRELFRVVRLQNNSNKRQTFPTPCQVGQRRGAMLGLSRVQVRQLHPSYTCMHVHVRICLARLDMPVTLPTGHLETGALPGQGPLPPHHPGGKSNSPQTSYQVAHQRHLSKELGQPCLGPHRPSVNAA